MNAKEQNNKNEKSEADQPFSAKFKKYIKNLIDFSHYDTKTIVYIVIFAFLIAYLYSCLFMSTFLIGLFYIDLWLNGL
ncbi:MAG: hypothetical protein ACFFB0_01340 [Promethearchaeota archaeon]